MNRFLMQTSIPASEYKYMELFLAECGFSDFDIQVSVNSELVIIFSAKVDALMFKLQCIEQAYNEKPYYFEPDTEFEIELEKSYGTYSQFDEVYRRTQG